MMKKLICMAFISYCCAEEMLYYLRAQMKH